MANVIRTEKVLVERGFGYREVSRVVVRCRCGREVLCDYDPATCDCGADYNLSGQELAPREQWGWDTGESVADILAPKTEEERREEAELDAARRDAPLPELKTDGLTYGDW